MATLSPRARAATIADALRSSLWPIPVAVIVIATALSFGTLWLDQQRVVAESSWWIFHAGPDGARSTLSALATSIMALAGVSISMTAVVLQLASNQFSPRVVRTFLRDLVIKSVVGAYVGAFTFTVLVLRAIRSAEKDGRDFVAPVSVALAVVLALGCVLLLVVFVHHVARSLQASAIVHRIAEEAKVTIAHLYPEILGGAPEPQPDESLPDSAPVSIHASTDWYLAYVDASGFRVDSAVVSIDVRVGDYVRRGDVVARVWAQWCTEEDIASALVFESERTMQQDTRFAFHLLADIALRALSPGINDPTTAVYCVNRIGDLLCRLVTQRFPAVVETHGGVRVLARRPAFDEIARLALEPIVVFGAVDARVFDAILDALDAIEGRDRAGRSREVASELRASIVRAVARAHTWTERQREVIASRCRR